MEFEEANKVIEKFDKAIGELGERLLIPFSKCAEKLREASIPLQMELCKRFAEEKGFKIIFETKTRGYRIKLKFRHWFKIPLSMWLEIRRGCHSTKDVISITNKLMGYL